MSDTPETDAAILTEPFYVRQLPFEVVRVDVCGKLERELNAAKAENEAMLDAVAVANYAICDLRLFASNECDMSLSNRALTKLRPFLK